MNKLLVIVISIFFACEDQSNQKIVNSQNDLIQEIVQYEKPPKCPENYTDSIVPFIYGYPTEELFEKSDSGLVALGGCELGDENWFCKIHKISFK